MSSCGHGSSFTFLPPKLGFLIENFPCNFADPVLDRALLRCRLCDGQETQEHANFVEAEGLELIAGLETRISETKDLLKSGKAKEDLVDVLPQLTRKLRAAIKNMDMKILDCWKSYWAVWGPGDGPEMDNEMFEGGEEDTQLEVPTDEEKKVASGLPKWKEDAAPELPRNSSKRESTKSKAPGEKG
ncbi:unnamed protein product [Diplocarpon coronariae]|uniref:Uncharacterized protein n=1 Tax=Diplocarpon coronariae TaxID=2795749 RepID=A0A218Z9B0_9HELO|nr:hypothetical protein B2J93_5700 [Marssonina coronariae]